jgi:LacI family transcriptional regulator, fructose operon transcriptional repressor
MGMPVSIKDVARKANVSSATVSRVLADKPYIRPETRRLVLKAVEELGYKPSLVARSLRVNRSNIIGLIVADIMNPFYAGLVRSIEETVYDYHYSIFLCNTNEDFEKESSYLEMMLAENVAGVILTPVEGENSNIVQLLAAKIPVVSVDREMNDVNLDSVVANNRDLAVDLVSHLIEDGHQRIGIIVGPLSNAAARLRLEGYQQALLAYHLPYLSSLVYVGPLKEQSGYELTLQMLDQGDRPSAILAAQNVLTLGCLRALREHRLRIPEDMGLAAFCDAEWASLFEPAITVAVQPSLEMGRQAVKLLFNRMTNDQNPCEKLTIKGDIFIRQSCLRHSTGRSMV